MTRAVLGVALLVFGCAFDAEPPLCRDPISVVFKAEHTESDCEDFVPPDLETCYQARGTFDLGSCLVEAEYFCGGVRATALFTFCAGEQAHGVETFLRIGDGCRVQRVLREVH